jgi:hypothetical protein
MVLHPQACVLVLYVRAFDAPAHPFVPLVGMATAVGTAAPPVALITTVSAACVASFESAMEPASMAFDTEVQVPTAPELIAVTTWFVQFVAVMLRSALMTEE